MKGDEMQNRSYWNEIDWQGILLIDTREKPVVEKRRCEICRAFLRSGNKGYYCARCYSALNKELIQANKKPISLTAQCLNKQLLRSLRRRFSIKNR